MAKLTFTARTRATLTALSIAGVAKHTVTGASAARSARRSPSSCRALSGFCLRAACYVDALQISIRILSAWRLLQWCTADIPPESGLQAPRKSSLGLSGHPARVYPHQLVRYLERVDDHDLVAPRPAVLAHAARPRPSRRAHERQRYTKVESTALATSPPTWCPLRLPRFRSVRSST